MSDNSWTENDSGSELDPISSLLSDLDEEDFESDFFFQGLEGRRRKAALVLTVIWGGTIALHLISWGSWVVWGLTGLLWMQAFRVLFAQPKPALPPLADESREEWPYVS